MRYLKKLLLFVILSGLYIIQPSRQDQSVSTMSNNGYEFVPLDSFLLPLFICTTKKRLYCSLECNKRIDCRTYDYNEDSQQCRLWNADMTTGSIVASPAKPRSSVGTIQLLSSNYVNIYNQSCDKCIESRYLICDTSSNTCQCPRKTYWNGSMCLAQLLRNQICSRIDACRTDLNLTCEPNCDLTYRCATPTPIGIGQTVAGLCNNSTDTGANSLQHPWGIYVSPSNGILYVVAYDNASIQSFSPFSRTGRVAFSIGNNTLMDIFVDSSDVFYITDPWTNDGTLYVQQGNVVRSIPVAGQSTSSCSLNGLYGAYGVAVDRNGNIYIALRFCYIVVKWTLNSTVGVLVAGQPNFWGSTSTTLKLIRFIHLDDIHGVLYVSDSFNNRIQQFVIGGNRTGVTVAGNGSTGTDLSQLNNPGGIWVTHDGQTLYVADCGNNRIMKWTIGASQGTVFAGNTVGLAGNSSQLFNGPIDIALDPTETYLYVSDYNNHRVQRFRIR